MSSVTDCGRAFYGDLPEGARMKPDGWKQRLQGALDSSGMTMRAASLAARQNAGYMHSILKTDRDPSVTHLIAVCQVLNVSLTYIIFGWDVSPQTERLLQLAERNPAARDNLLALLEAPLQLPAPDAPTEG
jgi:transcriptional regulator with XRE-family HTH domain